MSSLSRIGVAIDSDLLDQFAALIEERGYGNRSEAFRDLTRDERVEKSWESPESQLVGTVTLVHDHHHNILSTLHVHLNHDNCLEVRVIKGKSAAVRKTAALASTKGVKHGLLTITASGAGLK
ncbi:MAG TPA: nickel-responsive transcriptional regulator NikR [Bryobacteraceae bacterium]|nr:nickel-responsive transcriptional regulator NikR [Verrucomicrobiae bacterium]HUP04288.1 nickel-responsive transcriptional regulator NikR [Bryobacteraceae bacterium]